MVYVARLSLWSLEARLALNRRFASWTSKSSWWLITSMRASTGEASAIGAMVNSQKIIISSWTTSTSIYVQIDCTTPIIHIILQVVQLGIGDESGRLWLRSNFLDVNVGVLCQVIRLLKLHEDLGLEVSLRWTVVSVARFAITLTASLNGDLLVDLICHVFVMLT